MFEISQLKEKKLSELQDIAKELKMTKFKSLKKLDLVYKILDHQAANPQKPTPQKVDNTSQKPQRKRRERVQRQKDNSPQKSLDFKEENKPAPEAKAARLAKVTAPIFP